MHRHKEISALKSNKKNMLIYITSRKDFEGYHDASPKITVI
jgi:hypothetical protein